MAKELLPLEGERRRKPIMRPWKWIGLALLVGALLFQPWLPGILTALFYLCGIVVIFNLLFFVLRALKNRLFWSVRNRVIGSLVFVGLIPMLAIAAVIYLFLYMMLGQLAANYVEMAISEMEREISGIGLALARQIAPGSPASTLEALASRAFEDHAAQFPRLAARLVRKRQDGTFDTLWKFDPKGIATKLEQYPGEKWLGTKLSFEGLLREDGRVLMTALCPVPQAPDQFLDLSAPLDSNVEQRMEREKSIYATIIDVGAGDVRIGVRVGGRKKAKTKVEAEAEAEAEKHVEALEERRKRDSRRMISWGVLLESKNFSSGENQAAGFAVVYVPLAVLHRQYLSGSYQLGEILLKAIWILLGFFVLAEIVSLIIGGTISRRITRSIHDLYQGTLALQKGDLQHRIPVRRRDQLGLLAHSFNQMSASMVRLLEEVSEKKRLEQELEIAREVQATLFPRQLPRPRGLGIFGGCQPAQMVSGDYYDFVLEDELRLNVIVADISGKGISAALLMANLQAAMRNQLMKIKLGTPGEVEKSMSEIMIQLNEQIYSNSPSEKYATLILGRFDVESRRLFYCNAGHLPPILLTHGKVTRLEAGGTVLGLFPSVQYSSSSLELSPGAVLAVFTDGVTEAVNAAEEEFGEDRLVEALQEACSRSPEAIYRHVVDQVQSWQGSLKQHDDITLIVAKVE